MTLSTALHYVLIYVLYVRIYILLTLDSTYNLHSAPFLYTYLCAYAVHRIVVILCVVTGTHSMYSLLYFTTTFSCSLENIRRYVCTACSYFVAMFSCSLEYVCLCTTCMLCTVCVVSTSAGSQVLIQHTYLITYSLEYVPTTCVYCTYVH